MNRAANMAGSPGLDATGPSRRPYALGVFCVLVAMVLVVFRDTWTTMWHLYQSSETYAHGMVVPLVSLWLVWRQRARLRAVEVRAAPQAVLLLAACCAAWAIGHLAGVNALEHLAVVAMVPALVVLVFGWQMAAAIAFPLAFLFFAVPFGDFLLPYLMNFTADFTVAAVKLSGIPVLRENLSLTLPSGTWSIVEACSGLRYLLAAIPLSLIYAYLTYRSNRTRLLFVATTILVAIVANWLRAYLIVMLGHLSDMRLAVGVDHLIYGWLFFGVVMALAFWVGSFWADPPREDGTVDDGGSRPDVRAASRGNLIAAALLGAACIAAAPAGARALAGLGTPRLDLGQLAVAVSATPPTGNPDVYRPGYRGAESSAIGVSSSDPQVGVAVFRFRLQHEHGEMVTEGNGVLPSKAPRSPWRIVRQTTLAPPAAGADGPVNEYLVEGPGGTRLLVWEWYWVNGQRLTDTRVVKITTAMDVLRGRGDESAAWVMWVAEGGNLEASRAQLAAEAARIAPSARRAGF